MKKKKIIELVKRVLESADVKERCGLYKELRKIKNPGIGENDLLLTKAEEFTLWADSWIRKPLEEVLKELEK